jgi:pyruvate dehydrogenase E1 component beta subunit
MPSTPYDAKGLLKSAVRDDNLVLFFEHKNLYKVKGDVPTEEYTIPIGSAEVKRQGHDVTVVAYSYMVPLVLSAAQKMAEDGVEAEVIDLRTVDPLDEEAIFSSVKKTKRLVIVQEAWRDCSISSEIAARVAENILDYLDAPIVRVTAKDAPIPFSPCLEDYVLPNETAIINAVKKVVAA